MGRRLTAVLLAPIAALAMGACAERTEGTVAAPADITADGPAEEKRPETPAAKPLAARCAATDRFEAPVAVAGLEAIDGTARFSDDELGVTFSDTRLDGTVDLFQATRASRSAAFGAATPLGGLGDDGSKLFPSLTGDSRTLWFASMHVTDSGPRVDIVSATRSSTTASFGIAKVATALNVFRQNTTPFVARHASEVWFAAGPAAGSYEIFKSSLDGVTAGKPTQVVELSTEHAEAAPVLSDDGLVAYWSSTRPDGGARGDHDVWVATRRDTTTRFEVPRNVGELNTNDLEYPAWLSPDLCRLYVVRGSGPTTLLVAERKPR